MRAHAFTQIVRRLAAFTFAFGSEPEALQHLGVQVQVDRIGIAYQAMILRPVQVTAIPVAHVLERAR